MFRDIYWFDWFIVHYDRVVIYISNWNWKVLFFIISFNLDQLSTAPAKGLAKQTVLMAISWRC